MKALSKVIKGKLKERGFKTFDLPFQLNIVGIRKKDSRPGYFDDELHVFACVGEKEFVHHVFNFLTDTGTYWQGKKGKPQKNIMLAEGQYKECYQLLKTKNNHQLKQVKPVLIYTKYNRKTKLHLFNEKKESGMHRIDFHAAKSNGKYLYVPTELEGAQVFQRKEDYETFIGMCEGHEKLHGNSFTYTLIDERAKSRKRRSTISAIIGTVLALIGTLIGKEK